MATDSYFSAERRCQANEHCGATSRSLEPPVIALGNPGCSITFHCALCEIYVCGNCSKRVLMRMEIDGLMTTLWQLCCPLCGVPLGNGASDLPVFYSNHSGPVGTVNRKAGKFSHLDVNESTNIRDKLYNVVDYHHQVAFSILYSFVSQTKIDGSLMLVDKAIAEFPEEPLGWLYKSLLCQMAGYHMAGRNAWHTMLTLALASSPVSPVDLFSLKNVSYESFASNISYYDSLLKSKEQSHALECSRAYNLELMTFDERVRLFREGSLSRGDFVQELFLDHQEMPENIKVYLEALHYELNLNFPNVESERSKLINVLVSTMDKEDVLILLTRAQALTLGSVSQADFYNDLLNMAVDSGVDFSVFPTLSAYFQYTSLSSKIDAVSLLQEIWIGTRKEYQEKARHETEQQLVNASEQLYLLRLLVDVLLGKININRIPGTYASNPGAMRKLMEDLEEKPNVPFWKRLFRKH